MIGLNLPNLLTFLRIVLGLVFFVMIADGRPGVLLAALVVFIVAGITDLLDGYVARKQKIVTNFGRVADPFADKLIVCGGFIFFLAKPELEGYLHAWMVVVIVGRELLVTAMRSFAESSRKAFAATFWGKSKTLLQNISIGTLILFCAYLADARWAQITTHVTLYAAVAATAVSGGVYLAGARKLLLHE
jgi:CDP-diacylglycerol--glycerol-3-phosphate 3-phosphatidyltransferase